ncbi:MAG TPA: hypothetical protein ACFYD4_08155 [Candidatus Wunengus sp. YC61]|uniref:hypothetical protein n=1 Tax=Candidatus Wunengus sp. YC61 TaxID=3367698 RepID=UPI004024BF79
MKVKSYKDYLEESAEETWSEEEEANLRPCPFYGEPEGTGICRWCKRAGTVCEGEREE